MSPNNRLLVAVSLIVIAIAVWFIISPSLFQQLDELQRPALPTSAPAAPTATPALTPAP